MNKLLKKCIIIILFLLLIAMFIGNILNLNKYLLLGSILIGGLLFVIIYILNKKHLLNEKAIKIISIVIILLGILIRVYLLFTLKFDLKSDFKLYYNTALEIFKNENISQSWYLSFNGYVCIYSSILALLFKIFTPNIIVALIFNIFCQIGTIYILYKFIKLIKDNNYKYILPAIWFILPTVIEATFLVSTETLFIFLFVLTLYYFYKIKDNKNNIFKYILLGFLISFTNNIRPVMIIFIIALIIYYCLNIKKIKEILFLIITILTFSFTNILFQTYVNNLLNEPSRSGALAWSIYYGSSYKYGGYWNTEDSYLISELLNKENGSNLLLKASFDRYKDMGIFKSIKLMLKKYYKLWTDTNGNYLFLNDITNNNILNELEIYLEIISYFITLLLLIIVIINEYNSLKKDNYKMLFIELFTIGYILSNLIIVVNDRYNYPIYILLILLACNCNNGIIDKKDGE